jgi:hypothetical protein
VGRGRENLGGGGLSGILDDRMQIYVIDTTEWHTHHDDSRTRIQHMLRCCKYLRRRSHLTPALTLARSRSLVQHHE